MIAPKPTTVMLVGAAIAFAASWFAPVVAFPDASTWFSSAPQTDVYAGWRTFWVVLGLLWAPKGPEDWSDLFSFAIYVASALTNFIFLLAFVAVFSRWNALLRPLQWAVLVAGALDLYWLFSVDHLMIGYYLWVVSFFLLAAAMARRSVK
jgi:hypothetical protein